ncbi:MAG: universal stress protein [Azospirillaceae bacterium]
MFSKIMVPVDLAHAERLGKALSVAADISRSQNAAVVYVGVTASTPGPVAHTPDEFAAKLDAFAREQADKNGIVASARAVTVPDPTVDLHDTLMETVDKLDADLVVMATHVPGASDYVFAGYGAHLAAHSDASVFLIR